jgi:hypothetical protein
LRLGQRVGALVLDGVLGRGHQERERQRVGDAVDADLALFHRLEQRRLGLGRRPVDLVGEQKVGEDRTRAEGEVADPGVEDERAGEVAGHEVGRELHPLGLDVQRRGERPHEQRLGDAGHPFEQDVAAGTAGRRAARRPRHPDRRRPWRPRRARASGPHPPGWGFRSSWGHLLLEGCQVGCQPHEGGIGVGGWSVERGARRLQRYAVCRDRGHHGVRGG